MLGEGDDVNKFDFGLRQLLMLLDYPLESLYEVI